MVLALLSMIFGIVFFGYVIASVAASLANADSQRARYQEKLTAIQDYLKVITLSRPMVSEVKPGSYLLSYKTNLTSKL